MQRGPLLLAAAFIEVLRYFFLMLLAQSTGLFGVGGLSPSLLRYTAAPQLLFAASCFFLWYDRVRYSVFRPLALTGKALSFLAFIPLGLTLAGSLVGGGMLPSPRLALVSASALLVGDVFVALVLVFHRRSAAAEGSNLPVPLDGRQRGPEDIERVEGSL